MKNWGIFIVKFLKQPVKAFQSVVEQNTKYIIIKKN